jgi:hypothetical protein
MRDIIEVHYPRHQRRLVNDALNDLLRHVRDVPGVKKKPSTSELLDWLKLLLNEDVDARNAAREGPEQGSSRRCTAPC